MLTGTTVIHSPAETWWGSTAGVGRCSSSSSLQTRWASTGSLRKLAAGCLAASEGEGTLQVTAWGTAWVPDGLGEGGCVQRPGYREAGVAAWSGVGQGAQPGPGAVRAAAGLCRENMTSGPTGVRCREGHPMPGQGTGGRREHAGAQGGLFLPAKSTLSGPGAPWGPWAGGFCRGPSTGTAHCAYAYFDSWGQGTLVTVSSGESASPR